MSIFLLLLTLSLLDLVVSILQKEIALQASIIILKLTLVLQHAPLLYIVSFLRCIVDCALRHVSLVMAV